MPTKKKIYAGKIPFIDYQELVHDGKVLRPFKSVQLDYADRWDKDIVWKDNTQFFARLKIEGMSRGRSAANFSATLSDVEVSGNPEMSKFLEGKEVNLFMVDMLDIVTNCNLYGGKTDTNRVFAFCKRGMSYGVARVV